MALFSKRSGTLIVLLLVLGLALAQARVMGLQSCLPAENSSYRTYTPGLLSSQDWVVSIGRTGKRTNMFCSKTAFNVRLCCEAESKTNFKGCELADESREFPTCWGNKYVAACCTPSK